MDSIEEDLPLLVVEGELALFEDDDEDEARLERFNGAMGLLASARM